MNIITIGSSSKGNCYIVETIDGCIMLDAGLPISKLMKHITLSSISVALITHEHCDHSKAVDGLLKRGINVCMSEGTKGALVLNRHHRLTTCKAYERFLTPDNKFSITPVKAFHDAAEPLGFVVKSIAENESLLYITDTSHFDAVINGATYYMLECNYSKEILMENVAEDRLNPYLAKRIMKTHSDIDGVIRYLKTCDLSKAKEIRLLHLSNQNSDERAFKRAVQRTTGVATYVEKE